MPSWQSRLVSSITRLTVRNMFHSVDGLPQRRALAESADRLLRWFDWGFSRQQQDMGDGLSGQWIRPKQVSGQRVILYFHGGGFILRSPYTHGRFLARICRRTGMPGLMPDYRLAPEHPYPAAFEDSEKAYRWLLAQGYEPQNIVVAGDSAGGSLTLGLLVYLRDQRLPLPSCGVMLSPSLDPSMSSPSAAENAERDSMLSLESIGVFMKAYMSQFEGDDPRAKLVDADFRGLPPLLFQAGGAEILCDDAVRAARRALDQGVKVSLEVWPEMAHVFQAVELLPEARQAINSIAAFINHNCPVEGD